MEHDVYASGMPRGIGDVRMVHFIRGKLMRERVRIMLKVASC